MEYNVNEVKNRKLKFDDTIKGEYFKVEYTHNQIEDNKSYKFFLCFNEHNKALPLYMIGLRNAKNWIIRNDYELMKKIIKNEGYESF